MEEAKKPESLPEKMIDMLYHAMKALDEMRAKTLIYNKFRDTQKVADSISDLLRGINKKKLRDNLELKEVWAEIEEKEETPLNKKPFIRNLE